MIKNIILSCVLIWCGVLNALGNVPDIPLNYIAKAACRVTAGNARGSGVAVHEDDTNIYVLTNAHVIGRNVNVNVEFYKYGVKTNPIVGRTHGAVLNRDQDFAIIYIPKTSFGIDKPNIIPLAPPSYSPRPNTYFATAGNPFSRDMITREGIILKSDGPRIYFSPPPDNGQSGSGLFVNIDGKVYVAGIITFKSGDYRMDARGNPLTHGVAFHINQLRQNLRTSIEFDSLLYPVSTQLYALGQNGIYYPQNVDGSVTVPYGMRIQQWNCPEDQCPPQYRVAPQNRMTPLPRPISPRPPPNPSTAAPPNNSRSPFPNLPEGFGESQEPVEPEPNFKEQYDNLKIEHDSLKTEYNTLKEQYDALVLEVEQLKTTLQEKQEKLAELEKIAESQSLIVIEFDLQKKEITNLQQTIEQKTIQIEQYQQDITNLKLLIENNAQQQTKPETETIKPSTSPWYKNIVGGLGRTVSGLNPLWLLLLGAGGTLLFNKFKPLAAISSFVKQKTPTVKTYNRLSKLESKLEALADYIVSRPDKPDPILQPPDPPDPPPPPSPNIVNTNNINIDVESESNKVDDGDDDGMCDFKESYWGKPASDRIKQFFKLKKKDGESIEKWAFFALLYREAILILRRGGFDVDIIGHKVPLQGQRLAADKIDNWVREQFLKRTTIDKLNYTYLYHEAMLGFLYKEAVKLLRTGFFPVLCAKETANVIENWVKQEFLERMGLAV